MVDIDLISIAVVMMMIIWISSQAVLHGDEASVVVVVAAEPVGTDIYTHTRSEWNR